MDAAAIAVIGAVVGGLAKFMVNAGVQGKLASWGSVGVALLTMAIWAYAHNDFSRATSWDYFASFADVLLVAAGAFHVGEHAGSAKDAVRKLTGGDQ